MYLRNMNTLNANLDDLRSTLRTMPRRRANIRAMFLEPTDQPRLAYAEIVVGPRPEHWNEQLRWIYRDCAFVTKSTTASSLERAFCADDETGMPIDFGALASAFSVLRGNYIFEHNPSHRTHDEHHYPWPSRELHLSLTNREHLQVPQGFLIAQGSPSFPSAAVAFRAFFYGDYRYTGSINPSLGEIRIRLADESGRITRVKVQPSRLVVTLRGKSLDGSRLEFFSDRDRPIVNVSQSGILSIPLPRGMPEDAWIWLTKSNDWIDYCNLSSNPAVRSPRVDVTVPEDSEADLGTLIAQGESDHLEFKRNLPEGNGLQERRKMLKTVVAFAMGGGGSIVFGVEDESGKIVGVSGSSGSLQRQFADLVRDRVRPTPEFSTRCQMIEGKQLLIADIGASTGILHSLSIDANKPEYFVRRGATTFYARPEDLTQVLRSQDKSAGVDIFKNSVLGVL